MGQCRGVQTLFLAGGAFVLAWLSGPAAAQETPGGAFSNTAQTQSTDETVNLTVREEAIVHLAWDAPTFSADKSTTRIEMKIAAGGGSVPLDVTIAQRASLSVDPDGRVAHRGRLSELRVGRGLLDRRNAPGTRSLYAFVASDDEAITWQPGARNAFGGQGTSITLQNQVQIGDRSAGVTYQRDGIQASLAYVEREESTRVGRHSYSQDQKFLGLTMTMRL